ncbi:Cell cycle control protein 50A [Oopsacas minuta]|uniref:Cell cycle control protein 50A n=1 Tax=Oopsacas minuta TaxID=111878 RepID=A0AAV7JK75_9METZ|nr:Cell cycle control protein 50A [Oopsacas minuta]
MANGAGDIVMAEIQVTTAAGEVESLRIDSTGDDEPTSDVNDAKGVTDSLMRSKKERSWTRFGLRDRGKSAKTLSAEWWEGKEPFMIRGRSVPVFLMKWVLFLKYEEPPKHVSLLQQSAWAWRPRLNFWCILPILFSSCLFFIVFGIPMVYFFVTSVFSYSVDYTYCLSTNSSTDLRTSLETMLAESSSSIACNSPVNVSTVNLTTCEQYVSAIPRCVLASVRIKYSCQCRVQLPVDRVLPQPVFLFYELSNFYISHRRFTQSWFGSHFLSESFDSVDRGCASYSRDANNTVYFPCGMVPNAFFNDTIIPVEFPIIKKDITFSRYVGNKFVQPSLAIQDEIINNTASPAAWAFPVYSLPSGMENDDFMTWHSTSAFPNFRKLYGVVNATINSQTYNFIVIYNYPVTSVGASKFISFGTTAWMGGQPSGFLSYFYLVYGIVIGVCTLVIVIIHFPFKHWNKKSYLTQPY